MKNLITLILFLFIAVICKTQNDTLFNALFEEFDEFQISATNEFNEFNAQNDSLFVKFLENAWQEFEVFDNLKPAKIKPSNQPIIQVDSAISVKPSGILSAPQIYENKGPHADSLLKINEPAIFNSRAVSKTVSLYGINLGIQYYPDKLPYLNNLNETSIVSFYRYLSTQNAIWEYNVKQLIISRQKYSLNDWAYYHLVKKSAEGIFSNKNEQILYVWYALLKSNYNVKVAYDHQSVFLLFSSRNELYNLPFLKEDGLKYYLFPTEIYPSGELKTYTGKYYTQASNLSFFFNAIPKFAFKEGQSREFSYMQRNLKLHFNQNQLSFLSNYPQCDLQVYFTLPISPSILVELDAYFQPILTGKSDRKKVDILLDFIQNSIAYKTDQEQFGKERYMFAEECLFYPYADCEDRTILLAQLVKHYTDLRSIGLEYKEHITLAVKFSDEETGDFIKYLGKKFLICDPTYVNAKTGMLPADLKNEQPKVISF